MFETTCPCRTHRVGAVTLPRKTWTKTQGMSLQIWMYRLYRKYTGSLQDCERQNVSASCLESIPGVVVVRCPPATKNRRSIPLVFTYTISNKNGMVPSQGYLESSILHSDIQKHANKVETNWSFLCRVHFWPSINLHLRETKFLILEAHCKTYDGYDKKKHVHVPLN